MRHPLLGKMLAINGELQHVEGWHPLYHEPLVHIPSAFVTEVHHALILGGGSLFAASEVLLYPTVKSCTLVDHDPLVMELVARHYPHARRVLESSKFVYVKQDAIQFLTESDTKFDLLVNDCFDSISVKHPAEAAIFDLMSAHLTPEGVCADLIYRHVFERTYSSRSRTALEGQAAYSLSLITVPEYPGILHLLACWGGSHVSQGLVEPRNLVQRQWLAGRGRPDLAFYDPAFLRFYFFLPPYLRRMWETSSNEGATKAHLIGRVV